MLPLLILALLFVHVPVAQGQTGGGYQLGKSVISRGGATFSTGGGYTLGGSIGQTAASVVTDGSLALAAGFWASPPPPFVLSITTQGPTSTNARFVVFQVTFNTAVVGLDPGDFLTTVAGATIVNIEATEQPTVVLVTIDTCSSSPGDTCAAAVGNGTVSLIVKDNDSIRDGFGQPLGGSGAGNGDFSGGDSYNVNHAAMRFGEDIIAFEGTRSGAFTYDKVDWVNTKVTPNDAHVVRIDQAKKVLAGDEGAFAIEWHFTPASGLQVRNAVYFTSGEPVKEAMRLYHTNPGATRAGAATPVDLAAIPSVVLHFNTSIPSNGKPLACALLPTPDIDQYLCIEDEGTTGRKLLRGREKEGLILLQYNDAESNFIDFEIVRLKRDLPDGQVLVHIGSRLQPSQEPEDLLGEPQQRRALVRRGGRTDQTIQVPYIYQHEVQGSEQIGEVWAIRKNLNPSSMDVFWLRPSPTVATHELAPVEWPYERRQYTSQWPPDPPPGATPPKFQLYVRGPAAKLGPSVTIPQVLNPQKACTTLCEEFTNPAHHAYLNGETFYTDGPGWALLRYQTGPPGNPGQQWVGFEVVRSVSNDDPRFDLASKPRDIGTEILDAFHEGPRPGYIHTGTQYAPAAYSDGNDGGQIFAVNTNVPANAGVLEVWWSKGGRTTDPEGINDPPWPTTPRVYWPSKVARYDTQWPASPPKIIIAKQDGTGALDPVALRDFALYTQNDSTKPGFNPNDEHALAVPFGASKAMFALREDFGSEQTSLPYVLVQYHDKPAPSTHVGFKVWKVVRDEAPYFLHQWEGIASPTDPYEGVAGVAIQQPFPLSTLQYAAANQFVSGPAFEDHKGKHWARAAGNNGGTADIVMRYFYPVQQGFFFPPGTTPHAVGDEIPWLDGGTGTPADVTYTIAWPTDVPTMNIGDTLIEANHDLPQINGQCAVDIIYQQSAPKPSASLIDPIRAREVALASIPQSVVAESQGTEVVFPKLSLALRLRVSWNPLTKKLRFKGLLVNPTTGFDYALLNVMSSREHDELRALDASATPAWTTAVDALYTAAKDPIEILDSEATPHDALALTTGFAQGSGYVTLAMQDATSCGDLSVSLEIIKVDPHLNAGELIVITPQCPFDETITLRHQGDFGGHPGDYAFEWRTIPDTDGTAPPGPYEQWNSFTPVPADGTGAIDVTVKGAGLLTLSDNWFVARYRYIGSEGPFAGMVSDWTAPQLAPGWIKRVVGDINPFTQRATGGGIEGAEDAFEDYGDRGVNTVVSMISQAGPRFAGSVPLNCANLDDFGLIQTYETVLNRGIDFSIGGIPPVDYPPANNALLLVAGRIADLYTLLGNEAFADAADPTIAFDTHDGQYGNEASSIHCFQNETSSLLDEELALLRGRDDHLAPGVRVDPFYNRLIWNFTGDATGGEVAYALTHNISDTLGNKDGTIDEADAKKEYPQGHGDAWGHYLTAINAYYRLLTHPRYTWVPRAEAILVGGVPVTVDYLDERKFATVAAAKARTGSELVNLTYRESYVEDPTGQWQGYKDQDSTRAWGLSEWASRSGQGAYFDWIVGNAILPASDPNPTHTGIQKVDRTTVLELREVASRALDIQGQLDTADQGLNPLGVAGDIIPFDISPTDIANGKTHFEQIYERAVTAMNNAITVFDHAQNASELLRRQNDTLEEFQKAVDDRDNDFKNRLIESFGYPYSNDIGPGGSYPTGYDGPDLFHFTYVDASEITGTDPADLQVLEFPVTITGLDVVGKGFLNTATQQVVFHVATSGDRFGEVKPPSWTGERRAPGEIQLARSDLLQARARFERGLVEYDNLLNNIESRADLIQVQTNLNTNEITFLNEQLTTQMSLEDDIRNSRSKEQDFRTGARIATQVADSLAEFLPLAVGLAVDATAPIRGAIRLAGSFIAEIVSHEADKESLHQLDQQHALSDLQAGTNIRLTAARNEFAVLQALAQLEETVRQERALRNELYVLQEAMQQASGRYLAALSRGQRLLEDHARFQRQTAADVQARRYRDMAFRIFRNDALQKYRAQFDLAARYVYLAAKAYDFETTMLSSDPRAGSRFLTDIVRERAIGSIQNGLPQTGIGLADPLARMSQNFSILKGQLGFNNPQQETNRFSLRSELFRILPGSAGGAVWRETLRRHVVENLLDLPEFQQYARIFEPHAAVEPAIVIPFETNVNFALNLFGWPAGGGDNAYDSTNFATKVRSVGVWFSNYNNLLAGGLINTPRVYLFPAGGDILRSPTRRGVLRQFKIFDQALPVPFPVGAGDLADPDFIPSVGSLTETFGTARKYSSFRAFHDAGQFDPAETIRNSRLIGRSVWNTKWLLVIPAGTLNSNRQAGLDTFIDGRLVSGVRDGNGVTDIKIFFETYAYSGN